jgi:hypothetical protein
MASTSAPKASSFDSTSVERSTRIGATDPPGLAQEADATATRAAAVAPKTWRCSRVRKDFTSVTLRHPTASFNVESFAPRQDSRLQALHAARVLA